MNTRTQTMGQERGARAAQAGEDAKAWARRVMKGASAEIDRTSERARAVAGAERVAESAPELALEIAAQAWVSHGEGIEDAVRGAMGRWRFEIRLQLEAAMGIGINDDPWRYDSEGADRAATRHVLARWRAGGQLARARRSARALAEIGDPAKGRDIATLIAAGSAPPALWAKLAQAPGWTWREVMHDRALWRRPVRAWPARIAAARAARGGSALGRAQSAAIEYRVWQATRAWRWRDETPPLCALLALAHGGSIAHTDRERAAAIIAERAWANPYRRTPDAGEIAEIAAREPEATERWVQASALGAMMNDRGWSEVRAARTLAAIDEAWRRESALEHGGAETLTRLGRTQGVHVWHVPYTNAGRMIAGSAHTGEGWVHTVTHARGMKVDLGHRQRAVLGEIARARAGRAHIEAALVRVVRAGLERAR